MEKSTFWRIMVGMAIGSLLLMLIPGYGIMLGLVGLLVIGYYSLSVYYYYLNPEMSKYMVRSPYGFPRFFYNT
jgi:hypothetical protein